MAVIRILKDDFGCGSVAMLIVEDMPDKDVAKIKDKESEGLINILFEAAV